MELRLACLSAVQGWTALTTGGLQGSPKTAACPLWGRCSIHHGLEDVHAEGAAGVRVCMTHERNPQGTQTAAQSLLTSPASIRMKETVSLHLTTAGCETGLRSCSTPRKAPSATLLSPLLPPLLTMTWFNLNDFPTLLPHGEPGSGEQSPQGKGSPCHHEQRNLGSAAV